MSDLQALGTPSSKAAKPGTAAQASAAGGRVENWLGHIGDKDKDEGSATVDSDADGFTDRFETERSSDSKDPASMPSVVFTTKLKDRVVGADDDVDGLSNQEERRLGTDPSRADSDNDGVTDGAEMLSGSNSLDPNSRPDDTDHDGFSDDYEVSIGTNGMRADSDADALSDSIEIALGTNPRDIDTDRDGVTDGKEVAVGSDPLRPEQ